MEETLANYSHTGKPKNLERANVSTTDPTWTELAASLYCQQKNTTTTTNNNNKLVQLQLFNFGHYIQHPTF
jgi:hypothetical protein